MSTDANASVTSMRQARRSRPAAESGPGQTMADVTARAHVARSLRHLDHAAMGRRS
jgi:hypothetical protein